MFTLNVSYKGLPEFQSKALTLDQRIERAIKKRTTGSGYCFFNGERDISFTFRSKEKAEAAKKTIGVFAKKEKRRIKCQLFVED